MSRQQPQNFRATVPPQQQQQQKKAPPQPVQKKVVPAPAQTIVTRSTVNESVEIPQQDIILKGHNPLKPRKTPKFEADLSAPLLNM